MAASEQQRVWKPEHRLLLDGARTKLSEPQAERIRALLETDINWQGLLGDARRHRVALLLARSLRAVESGPETSSYDEHLREHTRVFAARNAYLLHELARLLALFAAERIPVIPYKGPVIATLAYGDVGLREFNDLDLLVQPQDIERASRVLRDAGFETRNRLTPREQAHVQKEFKEYCFQSGLVVVEPHWSITARRFPFPIDYAALWDRARPAALGHAMALVFAPEDMLVIQCVTGGKSRWRRLELVCDVAELLQAFPDLDWEAVEGRAIASGSARMLLLGLGLATELLEAPLPAAINNKIQADTHVLRLRRKVIEGLFDTQEKTTTRRSPTRFSPLLMAMRERPVDRWAYLWRTLTTPTVPHLRRYPLPTTLWPLYRVLVPVHDYIAQPIARRLAGVATQAHPADKTL